MSLLRGVLLDLDGVLYVGDRILPGATGAIRRLRDADLPVCFVTNTTRKPRRVILERLTGMGLDVRDDELLTPSRAAIEWLELQGRAAHLLIHDDLREDFAGIGDGPGAAVVLGDAADGFTYDALNECFRRIADGAPFLALARNRYFMESDGISLDLGAYVVGLEYATGQPAVVLGKPAPAFFEAALAIVGCAAAEAAMIGDDVEADVNGAIEAGLNGILVRTGKYRPGDDQRLDAGGRVADNVGAAVDLVLGVRR
jgi:HAD superfamily hydrolase (TIGR01458 family)